MLKYYLFIGFFLILSQAHLTNNKLNRHKFRGNQTW